MLEYKIVKKEAFTVMGIVRRFHMANCFAEIPLFWKEHYASGEAERTRVCGMYGISMGCGEEFEYMIADNYLPWNEIPEGCKAEVIPSGTWAVFPWQGDMQEATQSLNRRIHDEWLPSCTDYRVCGEYMIELYAPVEDGATEGHGEIWIQVERAE